MRKDPAAEPPPVAPGDDVCPVPPPLDEEPPADRFCDLVLTGGVASGVVYPWAIVELARAFRFRNIGGTSVGAMAAALAAAAEYGRRTNAPAPFEVLRRLPAALGEKLPDGRTRMLSLFQANDRGQRLMRLWGELGTGVSGLGPFRTIRKVLAAYAVPVAIGALAGLLPAALCVLLGAANWIAGGLLAVVLGLVGALVALVWAVWSDLQHGVIENGLGLCKGGTLEPAGPEGKRPAMSEWLHDGIQLSAGLKKSDPPLTFRDLWNAPVYPGGPENPCTEKDPVEQRSINLQMITTNVTHGRPYRLPFADDASPLFFKVSELKDYFPPVVLKALEKAGRPYEGQTSGPDGEKFLRLPTADLPIVVAARLSLSFPLLFSAVPLWAIDNEPPPWRPEDRTLKRCQFSDGGVSSNFPIHMFDAALPRWPTFGLWLDRHTPYERKPGYENVWLPRFNGEGWGDNWNRFDPESLSAKQRAEWKPGPLSDLNFLFGFIGGIALSAVDWRDRTSFRLPHVRNRVARLLLRPGEGGLNIAMPREKILEMAHRYGTEAGRQFVKRFTDRQGNPSVDWREQRWVRMELLVNSLRERLHGLATSVAWATHSVPMTDAIDDAVHVGPVRDRETSNRLEPSQARSLHTLIAELERLEVLLRDAEPRPYKAIPEPELRLRAPL